MEVTEFGCEKQRVLVDIAFTFPAAFDIGVSHNDTAIG